MAQRTYAYYTQKEGPTHAPVVVRAGPEHKAQQGHL